MYRVICSFGCCLVDLWPCLTPSVCLCFVKSCPKTFCFHIHHPINKTKPMMFIILRFFYEKVWKQIIFPTDIWVVPKKRKNMLLLVINGDASIMLPIAALSCGCTCVYFLSFFLVELIFNISNDYFCVQHWKCNFIWNHENITKSEVFILLLDVFIQRIEHRLVIEEKLQQPGISCKLFLVFYWTAAFPCHLSQYNLRSFDRSAFHPNSNGWGNRYCYRLKF